MSGPMHMCVSVCVSEGRGEREREIIITVKIVDGGFIFHQPDNDNNKVANLDRMYSDS